MRDVLVGKQLGDFVVKRRIGAGGMGIVYEGEHPIIGRKVAIKILRPEFVEGAQARDLIGEARAASAIRHRGIIDVFGFGTIPGVGQYLVMEFLDGSPLDEVIDRRGPMREAEVIALLDELLGALSAAHAMGVIHRDLKPGNIFVVRDSSGAESVKVLDFGLAKRSKGPHGSTPQTHAHLLVGTPEFMAPEQASGQPVSPATDLYAVGVIAFQMLTRRLPFVGDSPMAVVIQQVQARPPAPSDFVEVHPALEALVLKLLAKEPSARPASAEEVRRELKVILKQLDAEAAPQGASRQSLPGARLEPRGNSGALRVSTANKRALSSDTVVRGVPLDTGRGSIRQPLEVEPVAEEEPVTVTAAAPGSGGSPAVRPNRIRPWLGVAAGVVLLGGLGVLGVLGLKGEAPPGVVAASGEAAAPPPVEAAAPPDTPAPAVTQAPASEGEESAVASAPTTAPRLPRTLQTRRVGTLRLVVRGWAHIYVDGQDKGRVPPINELELPAGRHELLLINPARKPYRAIVRIKAGQTLEHRVKLAEDP